MNQVDNIYDRIQELLGDLKNSVDILEEQIDDEVQTEYFNYERKSIEKQGREDVFDNRDFIFSPDCSLEETKYMLCKLAQIDNIEAYKTLEKYARKPHNTLTDWAKLALKENRLLLKSRLLDESQVLVSTGLGGKGSNLRYFIVFFSATGIPFSRLHRKILQQEVAYAMGIVKGELETISFNKELCLLIGCIPLHVPVRSLVDRIIDECNQMGGFIHEKYVITNVRKFNDAEIRRFLRQKGMESTG